MRSSIEDLPVGIGCCNWRIREQARSHSGSAVNINFVNNGDQLWERACSRRGRNIHPRCICRNSPGGIPRRLLNVR
ncbi:hypothetical protein PkoCFBP13504_22770 [Pseudomonas koreensis]|nr:hypothetical protein PkoCFBP13504_22770 [Pseudomonas koreensis]